MKRHPLIQVLGPLAAMVLLACACSSYGPQALPPSAARELIAQQMGEPSVVLPAPSGGARWVYARGPMGRHTWMLDLDAAGRLIAWHQALGEAQFSALQPGLSAQALLYQFGPPADRRGRGLLPGEVWSYRYPTNNCLWFQVTLDAQHQVVDGSYGIDPRCDAPTKAGD